MRSALAVAVSLSVLLAACGGGGSSPDSGTPEDSGTPTDAGPTNDAGTPSDAGSSTDGGTETAGNVEFVTGTPGDLGDAFQIVADFATGSGTPNGSYMCTAMVNGCHYCPPIPDGGVGNLSFELLGAGTLTFTDGTATLATLPYDADAGIYASDGDMNSALTWNVGDTLTVSASGGAIPAFTSSITAPHLLSNVSPVLNPESSISISLSAGFTISWNPSADDGTMLLVLADSSSFDATISCTVAESAGSITVAPSVLSNYSGSTGGTVSLTKTTSKTINAGSVPVVVSGQVPTEFTSVSYTP